MSYTVCMGISTQAKTPKSENSTQLVKQLSQYRELLLSNLILLAEIPSPNGNTKNRADAIFQRLGEYDNLDISLDEVGNVIVRLEAKKEKNVKNTIVLLAHMDTHYEQTEDHTVQIQTNTINGIGLMDNSLGCAALMSIPHILHMLGHQVQNDVVLCFATDSLGTGDLKGTRFFLENYKQKIDYGICIEGYPLGRVSYSSIGMLRGRISHNVLEEFDWSRFGTTNAIIHINQIINRILEIPLPNRPRTSIVFNRLRSGASFNLTPNKASLLFEVRSQSNDMVEKIAQQIHGIVSESALEFGATVEFEEVARRSSGGLSYDHQLVRIHSKIVKELGLTARITPSVSDLSAFIDKQIPAVALGLTQCENYNQTNEIMQIEPCFTGLAQLIQLLFSLEKIPATRSNK